MEDCLTKHHRKPRSCGGLDKPINISMVPGGRHEAWHILFGQNEAPAIAFLLNEFYLNDYIVSGVYLLGKIAPRKSNKVNNYLSSRRKTRDERLKLLRRAWNSLFSGMDEMAIIEEINQIWLDPEYALKIVDERKRR